GHALAVKKLVAPDRPFPLSLHLGFKTAAELAAPRRRAAFRDWLRRHDCFIAGVNAFPFGAFHAAAVKTAVYRPDWRSPDRLAYTLLVARLLADLIPAGAAATLTTVPGGWRPDWTTAADRRRALKNLARAAAGCREIFETTGCRVAIAVEPEPGCAWELFDPAVEAAGPEIGWCLDACHAAVEFRPLARLPWQRIVRVQLSAAIECDNVPAARAALAPFVEPRYLHQTRAVLDGEVVGVWPDLAPALDALPKLPEQAVVRTHYHVPLTWAGSGPLRSTRGQLTPAFFSKARRVFSEVETYTLDVLPRALRPRALARTIAGELVWVAERYGLSSSTNRKIVSPGLA
ncbi:MAG: xylose isomerase, partial [Spartobacteria bacterium]|nr:xylose isomerase [Spartobacteria bacterium]